MNPFDKNSFANVSEELGKALIAAEEAKAKLDKANKALDEAGKEYQDAVSRAAEMRMQMNALLDKSLPANEIKPKIG